VKAKSQVSLYASWGNLILKMQHSTTRQAKQKISSNLDHHWSKKYSFLCVQRNWVYPSGTQRFCKNDSDSSFESLSVTRVESFCEKRNSSRIESPFYSAWLESSPSHQNSWLKSSHWLESRYHWIQLRFFVIIFGGDGIKPKP